MARLQITLQSILVYGEITIKEPSETIAKMIHCPAVNKPLEGHKKGSRNKNITCSQCGRCYKGNKGLYTAVYSH